jgi:hypothetical protein
MEPDDLQQVSKAGPQVFPATCKNAQWNWFALEPEVIFVAGSTSQGSLHVTRTVVILFAVVPDPVGSGFVASLARPGGNASGFMQFAIERSCRGNFYNLCRKRKIYVAQVIDQGSVSRSRETRLQCLTTRELRSLGG